MMKLRRRIRPATGMERMSRNSFTATRTICRKHTYAAATHHRLTLRSKPWRRNCCGGTWNQTGKTSCPVMTVSGIRPSRRCEPVISGALGKCSKPHGGRQTNEQDDPIRGMRPLRRDRWHLLRHMPILRIQAGRAQADRHGSAVWHDRQRILQAIREHVMEDVGILPWPPPSLAELEKALDSMDHNGITRGD